MRTFHIFTKNFIYTHIHIHTPPFHSEQRSKGGLPETVASSLALVEVRTASIIREKEEVRTSETSVYFNENTRHYMADYCNLQHGKLFVIIACVSIFYKLQRIFNNLSSFIKP
jgi:hypothetical protein